MVHWDITANTYYTTAQKLERLEKAVSEVDIATKILDEYISMNFDANITTMWDKLYSKIQMEVSFRVQCYNDGIRYTTGIEQIIKRIQEEYTIELCSSLYQLLKGVKNLEDLLFIKNSPKFKNIQKRCHEFDNLAIEIRKKVYEEEWMAEEKHRKAIERKEKIERLKAIVALIWILLTFLWLFSQ